MPGTRSLAARVDASPCAAMEGGEVTGARPVLLRGARCVSRRRAPGTWVPALEGGDPACGGHAGRMGSPGGRCRGRWGGRRLLDFAFQDRYPLPPAPSQATFRLQVIGGWAAGAGERRRRPALPHPAPTPPDPGGRLWAISGQCRARSAVRLRLPPLGPIPEVALGPRVPLKPHCAQLRLAGSLRIWGPTWVAWTCERAPGLSR